MAASSCACSAALITGRNHHSSGFGVVAEQSTGFPGYDFIIARDKATIGRILKDNGYRTSWFGKDHNTPEFQASQDGPFDQWPIGMGFEYFYGFIGGDANQWQPNLFRNTTAIYPYVGNPGWNLITAQADDAIGYMRRINALNPEQPWFIYYVPGASHAPHHPTPEWIKKISDMHLFDKGWNALRDEIFANQKKLGVIPQDAKLTPWPDDLLKRWDALNPDEKKMFLRQVDVFAAYVAYSDYEIGRVIQEVENQGKRDNTLIVYISGDNGNSAEGTLVGTPNEVAAFNGVVVPVQDQLKYFYDVWGTDQTYPHMAVPWTWAFDTPFSWTKQIASHFGGTRQGMAISWPKVITDKGGIRNQFHHIIDIVPTILEATGIRAPDVVDGIPQKPIEGVSMAYTFDKANANAPSTHKTQYFEMMGDHAIYHDGWIASTKVMRPPWDVLGSVSLRSGGLPMGVVRSEQGLDAVRERRRQVPGETQGTAGPVLGRGAEVSGAAAGCVGGDPAGRAAAEPYRRPHRVHLVRRTDRHAKRRRAVHPRLLVHLQGRGGDPKGWRGRGDRDPGRPVRRLRLLHAEEQAGVPVEPGRFEADWWEGADALSPGKHTLEFDFKYDGLGLGTLAFNNISGIGRSGTGVLRGRVQSVGSGSALVRSPLKATAWRRACGEGCTLRT